MALCLDLYEGMHLTAFPPNYLCFLDWFHSRLLELFLLCSEAVSISTRSERNRCDRGRFINGGRCTVHLDLFSFQTNLFLVENASNGSKPKETEHHFVLWPFILAEGSTSCISHLKAGRRGSRWTDWGSVTCDGLWIQLLKLPARWTERFSGTTQMNLSPKEQKWNEI